MYVWMFLLAVMLMVGQPAPTQAQDGIDLSRVVYHGADLRQFQPTVTITGVEFASGETRGVRLLFDRSVLNARWPAVQVWNNNPADPLDGQVQWTFGACVQSAGRWHCAPLFEMWGDAGGTRQAKEWTGAPPWERAADGRNQFQANWAYDCGRFGAMCQVAPQIGEEMAFFMVAGGVRPGTSNHPTVAERSNVVRVTLAPIGVVRPLVDGPVYVPTAPAPTPVPPTPAPQPTPAPVDADAFRQWAAEFERWAHDVAAWSREQTAYQNGQLQAIQDQNERIYRDLVARVDAAAAKAPTEPVRVDQGNARGILNLILGIAGAVGGGIAAVR